MCMNRKFHALIKQLMQKIPKEQSHSYKWKGAYRVIWIVHRNWVLIVISSHLQSSSLFSLKPNLLPLSDHNWEVFGEVIGRIICFNCAVVSSLIHLVLRTMSIKMSYPTRNPARVRCTVLRVNERCFCRSRRLFKPGLRWYSANNVSEAPFSGRSRTTQQTISNHH